jgi:ubiquinone/menaquinone biosynthesis C-methylase UbiE
VPPTYDRIGLNYSQVRRADRRFEAAIWKALGEAKSVVNVGAGTGSYEPPGMDVIAVEPSPVMIAQRPGSAAPAIIGVAEQLPLEDKSVDAAMAVLSIQHWQDVDRGLGELLRVARRAIVLVTIDVEVLANLWLVSDYLPETLDYHARAFPSIDHLLSILPSGKTEVLAVPCDCADGFFAALWGRPEAHLDPRVRQASSVWHDLPEAVVAGALERIRRDLDSGVWDERYGELRSQRTMDVGLRIVSAQPEYTSTELN